MLLKILVADLSYHGYSLHTADWIHALFLQATLMIKKPWNLIVQDNSDNIIFMCIKLKNKEKTFYVLEINGIFIFWAISNLTKTSRKLEHIGCDWACLATPNWSF